jgi:hypothetical protein
MFMVMMRMSCAYIDRECVGELDPITAVNALGQSLDDNVNLMWRTPNLQNIMLGTRDTASHDTGVLTCHGVFAVSRHADQLHATLVVKRIHKLADHIEDTKHHVSHKH